MGRTQYQSSEQVQRGRIPSLPQPFASAWTIESSSLIWPGSLTTTTNLNNKGVVYCSRNNQIIIRRLRRTRRLIIGYHGTRPALWWVRSLKRRFRDWSLLGFKFPTVTSTSRLLSNLKALLTTLAFIKPNVIKRRRCVYKSTVLGPFNVGVAFTRCLENIKKAFVRRMIQRSIIENCLKVIIVNQMELGTDIISL
jgi:hypothetical protein